MPTLAPRPTLETDELLDLEALATKRPRRKSSWKKLLTLALVGSLVLHAILILVLAVVLPHWPRKPLKPGTAPFHLSIVRTNDDDQKNAATLVPRKQDNYIRTTDQQQQDKPDEFPDFISDKDTHAASEKPADPNKPPLPSQDGREIPTYDFDTTPYRPGKEASSAASAASAPSQTQQTAVPNETPRPDRKSTALNSKTKTAPRKAAATPTPVPDGELAMAKGEPTPDANEPPKPEETPSDTPPPPSARTSSQPASRPNTQSSVASTGLPKPPGYQPQTIQSKMSGSITNRGKTAPSAIATPLGRYQKAVEDAIGSMWYLDVNQQMSYIMSSEEVRLHFYVTRSGRVRSITVSQGKSGTTLASISVGAVNDAQIMPIPADVAETLPGGELEVDMGFGFYLQ